MKVPAFIENRPIVVTASLTTVVAAWRILAWRKVLPSPLEYLLSHTDLSVTVAIALGLASVAAVAAGFAGFIIIFGISSDSSIMRAFRAKTELYLRPNWKSIISNAFLAAVLGLACAVFLAAHWIWVAAVSLALGALLLVHSMVRMVWLFGILLALVSTQDQKDSKKANRRSTADVFKGAA
ncbi:hypothetical protein MMAN_26010 [Mycobacterium mantenii]|uniref:Uncharacterized protein n=1 Tax=Mycobacterium mantenii TaxID=560555 RepID=A0ABM7JSG3_MYCNT|nr:hypothetical protein [Mycobacterium mantenii]MCV7243216.1 hypothetical protein [Mycobacterium mantenii]BBY38467.1 hypothetical protein MMAN_26010 [Mycobacterium mantenii]